MMMEMGVEERMSGGVSDGRSATEAEELLLWQLLMLPPNDTYMTT